MLVQGNIKYGCKLPICKNGTMVQTYLSSAIDDHSRLILTSEFYDNKEELIVKDIFRKVILLHGIFDSYYFDNGSQYHKKGNDASLIPIKEVIPTIMQ